MSWEEAAATESQQMRAQGSAGLESPPLLCVARAGGLLGWIPIPMEAVAPMAAGHVSSDRLAHMGVAGWMAVAGWMEVAETVAG